MRVVHLSYSDTRGGAARGAWALHHSLCVAGIDSHLLTTRAFSVGAEVHGGRGPVAAVGAALRWRLDKLPLLSHPARRRDLPFSPAWLPSGIVRRVRRLGPDLVNLHWVGNAMVRPEDLPRLGTPLVWTIRDAWPMTGGCHVVEDCQRFREQCGRCPQLHSEQDDDLSRRVWRRKRDAYAAVDLTVVGLSRWIAERARESSLLGRFPSHVIPNGVDAQVFRPLDRVEARRDIGLSNDDRVIVFGAYDALRERNKGFHLLRDALPRIGIDKLRLVVFGNTDAAAPDLSIPATLLGVIEDDAQLAKVYAAADVVVVPSIQESFGKTALEAMACARPVVCFDTSGLKDLVEHRVTGYLAACYDPTDLARGVSWVLGDPVSSSRLGEAARARVEARFTLERVAAAYVELYRSILTTHTGGR